MRCAFCGKLYTGPYPRKTAGVHTVICEHCHRAFIIHVVKRWWGYQRSAHVR